MNAGGFRRGKKGLVTKKLKIEPAPYADNEKGAHKMTDSILSGKRLLAVDDEPDVLDTLQDILSEHAGLVLDRATDYETGFHLLRSWTYDAVILDIMGVRGFDLLNAAVHLGFPTVMLTAHALSSDYLKKSIEMGARAYIPKEKMSEIAGFLEDVLSLEHPSSLMHMFNKLGSFFNRRFGSRWMENEKTFWEQVASGTYEPKPVIFKK
jgi:CheY-like chemotaxis protein